MILLTLCIENLLIYKSDWLTVSIESCFYQVTGYCVIKLQGWLINLVIGMWDKAVGPSWDIVLWSTSAGTRVGMWPDGVRELAG